MKSLRLLKKRLTEGGVNLTHNVNEAIYILPDGTMIDGDYRYGDRCEDHRCIFVATNYGNYYESPNTQRTHWNRLHKEYGVVMLVPETGLALITKRQKITEEQKKVLRNTSYTVEEY